MNIDDHLAPSGRDGATLKYLACIGFVSCSMTAWLLPFGWHGWRGHGSLRAPRALAFQWTAAGLFTRRSIAWWDQHLEIQDASNSRFEIPKREVFPMGAFGFRTRYDRILMETNRSALARQVRQRLAEHVLRRLDGNLIEALSSGNQVTPRQPCTRPVKAIRLVRTLWPVGDEALVRPSGRWRPPPVPEVGAANRQVLGTYKVEAGSVVEVIPAPRRARPQAAIVRAQVPPANGSTAPLKPPVVRRPYALPSRISRTPAHPSTRQGPAQAFVRPSVAKPQSHGLRGNATAASDAFPRIPSPASADTTEPKAPASDSQVK